MKISVFLLWQAAWKHITSILVKNLCSSPQQQEKDYSELCKYILVLEKCYTQLLLGSKVTADGDCSHEIKRRLLLGGKVMTNLDSILKKQRHYFANKGPSSQGYGFSSGHVWIKKACMDHKELMLLNCGVGEDS